jgi:hypothetical protein
MGVSTLEALLNAVQQYQAIWASKRHSKFQHLGYAFSVVAADEGVPR